MLAMMVSSFLTLYLFTTYGYFFANIAKLKAGFTEKALLGLVFSNTVTTILSLFIPINTRVLVLLLVCSFFMLYFIQNDLKDLLIILRTRKNVIWYSLPFILIAFVVSLGPPTKVYDTGLYHLQTIKWIEAYSVIPGLANLHGRFGFNPNIFTLFACTSLFEVFKQEIFSVNFTIYSILVLHFTNKIHLIFKQDGVSNQLLFNLIIFVNIIFTSTYLHSPSPNFILAVIPFFILASASKPSSQSDAEGFKNYIPILILCVYVVTVKLATIPLMLLAFLIAVRFKSGYRKSLWLLPLLALIVLPWLIRNILLTGWLLYPLPSLDLFNFDWKVPLSGVVREKAWVTGYARNPGDPDLLARAQMSFSGWFPLWWHKLGIENKVLFVASLAAPALALAALSAKKVKIGYWALAVIATSFFGVLFWFTMAPAVTFGKPFLIAAAISPLLYLKSSLSDHWKPGYKLVSFFYTVIVILFAFNARNISTRFNIAQALYAPIVITKPNNLDFRTYNTSGVTVYVPTLDDRCYDHQVPCTPYPDGTLLLRDNTLQSGFRHATVQK
jgi:hypothetical protein